MSIRSRSRGALVLTLVAVALVAATACQGTDPEAGADAPTLAQPYAGLQSREIRALAPERVADLLAGRGAGYALAAELNHYPGPTHVLALAAQLELSAEQHDSVSSIKAEMQQEAARRGAELVNLEEELDGAFRLGLITPEWLASLTDRIADVDGRLRRVHLYAHLQMVDILSDEQVVLYDEFRGYLSSGTDQPSVDSKHELHNMQ